MKIRILAILSIMILGLNSAEVVTAEWVLGYVQRITYSNIDYDNVTLEQAIDHVRARSFELEPENFKISKDLAFIVNTPESYKGDNPINRKITYTAQNITMIELLTEFGRQTKLDVYVTNTGVIMSIPGHPPFPNNKFDKGRIIKTLYKAAKDE